MHPIERLRFVARASGADTALLAQETAGALSAFVDDPAGLVTACRRIVSRHPANGPLWWLCSRVLCSVEPAREAWRAVEDLDTDATGGLLAATLPDGATVCVVGWGSVVGEALGHRGDLETLVIDVFDEGAGLVRRLRRDDVHAVDVPLPGLGAAAAGSDLVLLEASAVGPHGALAVAGSTAAAAVAHHAGVPVWLVAGRGRLLPARVFDHARALAAAHDEPWDRDDDHVPLELVECIAGPDGPEPVAAALRRTDCPVAPELLR
ncbi:MAG: hypothetical protein HYX34_14815 [Actinobacteria bacterium]|nr:hypothetical protein [Actinomycetota bacterium]